MAMELNQYEIRYLLRATIKGQAIANFNAKLTLDKELKQPHNLTVGTKEPLQAPQSSSVT